MNSWIVTGTAALAAEKTPLLMNALYLFVGIITLLFTIWLIWKTAHSIYRFYNSPRKPKRKSKSKQRPKKPDGRKHRTWHTRLIEPREVTLEHFFRMRQRSMKSYKRMTTRPAATFTGVYILYNRTKQRHYVGQSIDVFSRIHQHFRGRGSQDVYLDLKRGHDWTILLVKLDETDIQSLNELERRMIHDYDAFYNGYNKTRGNK